MPPKIDPKRKNFEGFKSTYQYFKYVLIIFLLGIEVITLLTATGVIVNRPMFMQIFVSLLIILIGNKLYIKHFVGIYYYFQKLFKLLNFMGLLDNEAKLLGTQRNYMSFFCVYRFGFC